MSATLTATPKDRQRQLSLDLFRKFASSPSQNLRHQLFLIHLPLARYLARRFSNKGVELEVLEQVAAIGLLKAIDRYDPSRNIEFSTFATHTITGELKRHFRDKGWTIRIPRSLQELYLRIGQTFDRLTQELGRHPTVSELAARLERSDADISESILAGQVYRVGSIDAAPPGETNDLVDLMGQEEKRFGGVEFRTDLERFIGQLPPRQQQILYYRFWEGMSQAKIGAKIGISQMHVSRLLARSLNTLKGLMSNRD